MSASLVVDLAASAVLQPSISADPLLSGGSPFAASGGLVGGIVDLNNANTYCNLYVTAGQCYSGNCRIAVQTSDSTTSGTFTDPTSGLAALPTTFQSGGLLWLNSGGGSQLSGMFECAAFQRPHRYARAVLLSGGFFAGTLSVGFISQRRSVGSGGGFTYLPGSGTVNV